MTPDLGKYAFTVLGAYGAAALLLGGLVLVSVLRAAAARRALDRQERQRETRRGA